MKQGVAVNVTYPFIPCLNELQKRGLLFLQNLPSMLVAKSLNLRSTDVVLTWW
jgi:16S rRNA C967 or C1407 C5-methylase (RsmB/RsmF family)